MPRTIAKPYANDMISLSKDNIKKKRSKVSSIFMKNIAMSSRNDNFENN